MGGERGPAEEGGLGSVRVGVGTAPSLGGERAMAAGAQVGRRDARHVCHLPVPWGGHKGTLRLREVGAGCQGHTREVPGARGTRERPQSSPRPRPAPRARVAPARPQLPGILLRGRHVDGRTRDKTRPPRPQRSRSAPPPCAGGHGQAGGQPRPPPCSGGPTTPLLLTGSRRPRAGSRREAPGTRTRLWLRCSRGRP